MMEREPSQTPRNNDATDKATDAATGDIPLAHPEAATVHAASPQRCTLQFLVSFIKKTDPGDQSPPGQ